MARRPNIEGSLSLHLCLPESERARLDLYLWSDAEGCVPRGRYQKFFLERLREFFSRMEPYVQPGSPQSNLPPSSEGRGE